MVVPNVIVAIAGTDEWLRGHLARRLSESTQIHDCGVGTSQLQKVDVLVLVPSLVPRSGSGASDIGFRPALHTLNAAHAFSVGRVVLISRVGQDSGDTYLGALNDLERQASASYKKLTIVRLTHPFGVPDDCGPVLDALAGWDGAGAQVQPVYVSDAVDAIAAAIAGRCGTGVVEVGGPETMSLDELAGVARATPGVGPKRASALKRLVSRSARGYGDALERFLAVDSVVEREYAVPALAGTQRLADIWPALPST